MSAPISKFLALLGAEKKYGKELGDMLFKQLIEARLSKKFRLSGVQFEIEVETEVGFSKEIAEVSVWGSGCDPITEGSTVKFSFTNQHFMLFANNYKGTLGKLFPNHKLFFSCPLDIIIDFSSQEINCACEIELRPTLINKELQDNRHKVKMTPIGLFFTR